jgi:hypothetical protein
VTAAAGDAPAPLSREDIDRVVDSLTMGDIQAAFLTGVPDKASAGVAFTRAARRLGVVKNGTDPLDLVTFADAKYLGERIQAAMADDSPKSGSTAD